MAHVVENAPLDALETEMPLPASCRVTVLLDGDRFEFDLAPEGKPIVDAANDAGIDAPWSCHAGVCATCRAKLLEGKVRMENHHALTQEEIEEGWILSCQSHPVSAEVVIDYDV
ncbi:MAG: 2Fe-2S iron-sulfur cluster binding domain-containing protein [Saprospirales bacterium]|jgi:ring-1,2-phenylacetyl-CoA epoxidase subunit PaaE|nr:2Fe-2S iron-sulfur cluster binding domain-containing protein [Saprospirales bacterium]MBK8924131.1 2Fe-2S iron-sulfur cluster binding domain-containing protein [Saprospirales bacterium]